MTEASDPIEIKSRRVVCFEDQRAVEEFEEAFTELLQRRHHQAIASLLPPENFLRYNHGDNWEVSARPDGPPTKMKTLSTKWELPWQSLVDNDLGSIERSMGPITTSMGQQFAEMVYGTVGEVAERVGNVVDAREQPSLADAFAAMLERIEFGVGRDGRVSVPEMHGGPEVAAKMQAALEAQPPEFTERINRIFAEKTEKALAAEAARKAKFKRPDTK